MEHLLPWFALKSVPGVGNHLFKRLIDRFQQPETIFETPRETLIQVDGISGKLAARLSGYRIPDDVKKAMDRLEKKDYGIITYKDPSYPALLREIPDPPPFLYVKGRLDSNRRKIAMVGSRNGTRYGLKVTHHLAGGLVQSGFSVVSGMAVGIDTAAHLGALEAGGTTIAVLGSGLERIYPKQNRRLFYRIAENGAVVTEFSPLSKPDAHHFPARNRIISGMSLGCVVVEAAPKSGSLITARLAADQNREVFAVPGSIHSYKSGGTHALIKEGAKLVMHVGDILEELPPNNHGGRGSGAETEIDFIVSCSCAEW